MDREDKIRKWLKGGLSDEEFKEFEQSDAFKFLIRIDRSLQQFKAPEYSGDTSFIDKEDERKTKVIRIRNRMKVYLSIAASFIAVFSVVLYLYVNKENSQVVVDSSSQKSIYLPDSSFVNLNTKSSISYYSDSWNDNKAVQLTGEAFFSVEKKGEFLVNTTLGRVIVLGTKFNVTAREKYFEVTCFEGKVNVSTGNNSIDLKPGESARVINDEFSTSKNLALNQLEPSWLKGETSFKSLPARLVIGEFERQYNITLKSENIDTNQLISGSFVHGNIEIALESISIPLNCTYKIADKKITLHPKDTH